MVSINNLRHLSIKAKMFAALSRARVGSYGNQGFSTFVKNRKGKVIIRVVHTRGLGGGFKFYDNKKNDITQLILKSLRES